VSISSEPVSRHCLLGNIVMDRTMLSVVFKNQENCCECEPDGDCNAFDDAIHRCSVRSRAGVGLVMEKSPSRSIHSQLTLLRPAKPCVSGSGFESSVELGP
jgi:hypothetical protein